ncbi:TlpA family protein disulfide reductase [bacterium]|nr:TlpA family protein disulfide reductase [bacterium]|tara:strand:- start:436 stop:921 length:486 start_codon:yes stop_codon:yes gene_type:complete
MINITKYYLILVLVFFILGCNYNQNEKNVFSPSKIDLKVLVAGKKDIQEYEFYIINFWASWCIPCKNEVPILNKLDSENRNLKVIGISIMDVYSESLSFIKSNNVQFENYWDEKLVSLKNFNSINSIPVTLIFNNKDEVILRLDGELDQKSYFKILEIVKK